MPPYHDVAVFRVDRIESKPSWELESEAQSRGCDPQPQGDCKPKPRQHRQPIDHPPPDSPHGGHDTAISTARFSGGNLLSARKTFRPPSGHRAVPLAACPPVL